MSNHQMAKNHIQSALDNPLHRVIRTFWNNNTDPFFDESWRNLAKFERQTHVSLSEDDKKIYVEAAVPGLNEKEIEVTLEKGVLWIHGEKKEVNENRKYHCRSQSTYSYHIALPESVNEAREPEARYEKGILYITFEKIAATSAKRIHIKGF